MIFRLAAWDRRRGASRRAEDRRRRRLRPTLLVLEERKLLSTIVVNNPTDTPVTGQIDLRQAIATANTSGGSETITFDSTVFAAAQTIKLTNGPLELSDAAGTETITGPAAGLTISGGGLSGVFQVDKGVTASMTGLAITGGQTAGNGGGVSNSGTLTLTDCTVSGNTAGNGSDPADGGGIYNDGTLSLSNSTITANRAAGKYFSTHGGGLFNSGTLTATNCTVVGNSVREYIGGGGGIQNSGGTATLTNTIVINNSYSYAYGSGPTDIAGTVAGTYNLIGTGGSGGLVNGVGGNLVGVADPLLGALGNYGGPTETIPLLPGSPAIDAGTFAGAPVTDQRGEPRVGAVDIGAFESQGFTLTPVSGSTPQTATIGATFANPLAVTVTANNPVEPVDGGVVNFAASPASNGATAILLTSSAVIAGGQAGVTGGPNNMDGSYTVTASGPGLPPASLDLTNAGPTLTRLAVNTTSSSLFAGAGELSLPLAVAFANTDTSGIAGISFDPGVFGTPQTITLTGKHLELSNTGEAETITGPAAGVTISGARLSRVLQVDGGVTATITGLTISGGLTAGNGGGVSNSGTLTVTDCTVNGNTAGIGAGTADGGGIYNDGTLTVTDSTVTANLVDGDYSASSGGGLFNSGTLNVTSSTITANFARSYGEGGIQNSGGTATLTDTIVTDNKTYFGASDIAGTVTGTYNLIGTGGSGGLASGVGGNLVGVADAGLGALGNYGGPTETIPLLPGSPAIDAGTSTGAPATDQRGEGRVGAVDIGAFESQGFTMTSVAGSTPQTATIGAAFSPLAVTVTANNPVEPVDGGIVNFAATPASNGATAILPASSAVIAGGQAGVIGGPNNVDGSYSVTASVPDLAPVTFDLTNAGPAFTSLVVNTASGSPFAGAGLLSLPLAVDFANADTSGNADISFDPGVFGAPQTITLAGAQLELSNTGEAETVTGPAAGVTINGGNASRVFQVDTGVTATFSGLTITGGKSAGNGGGLYNDGGTVALTDCTVVGNSSTLSSVPGGGGGIATANGTTTLTGCTVNGNTAARDGGGLILNGGTMMLTNSTVSSNSSVIDGGGLSVLAGTMAMINSTVTGNSAQFAVGGGVANLGRATTLTDTIVAGNTSLFGPSNISGTVAGTYNLIGTGGSGGLANGTNGNLVGVADAGLGALGNYGGPTETIPLLPGSPAIDAGTSTGAPATDQRGEGRVGAVDIGAFESQGFTMTSVAGSTPQTATIGAAFSPLAVTVTANNPVEPVDGGIVNFAATPASNGATAILLDSSAVIAGGQAGVIGGPNNVDGSYTATASVRGLVPVTFDLTNTGPAFTSLIVNTTSNSLFAGPGLLSLPLAVNFANADTSGNANISFDPVVFGAPQTITLTGSQLELSNTGEAETITGPAAGVTISGGGLSGVFQVDSAVQATISGLTLIGGIATYGGAVNNLGTLNMSDCLLEHNTTKPALVHFGGFSTVAEGAGGAIANGRGATLSLTDCTLTGNSTSDGGGSGGAILNVGTATLTDCSLSGNISPAGGAIDNIGVLTLTGCQLKDNAAPPANFFYRGFGSSGPGFGGAIINYNGTLNLVDCTLTGNSANEGGALFNQAYYGASQISLTDCTLTGNTAVSFHGFFGTYQPNGGAIASDSFSAGATTLSLTDCTLTGNTAGTSGGSGGAIQSYCSSSYGYYGQANVSLKDCTLSGNATGGIGGAVNTSSGTLTMDGCTLTGNSAGQAGGGAAISGTDTLTNCTISGNTSGNGGGVDIYGTSQISMSNCTVKGNTATGEGGGLFVQGVLVIQSLFGTHTTGPASLTLNGVTVSGNSAASGGGIYNAGTLTANGMRVLGNSAATGGGIDNAAGATATISDSMIVDNASTGDGGGIANGGTISLTDTTIVANTAAGDGGGVDNSGTAALVDCQVSGNSAASGGGIYAAPAGTVKLTGTLVVGNRQDNVIGTVTYD